MIITKEQYNKAIFIRAFRRGIRKELRKWPDIGEARKRIIFKDHKGVDIFKSRRYKNKILPKPVQAYRTQ